MGNVRKGRDIDVGLCGAGFIREVDGDHIRYVLTGTDVQTKISHGMKGHDVGRELVGLMARQLHLTKRQFLALIDGEMSEDECREILRNGGIIS